MDADAYPQEVLADEEPKYLRRQKPLEIKRRKFGKKGLEDLFAGGRNGGGGGRRGRGVHGGAFLLASQEMALIHPEQIRFRKIIM